jgi:hypothetical protein
VTPRARLMAMVVRDSTDHLKYLLEAIASQPEEGVLHLASANGQVSIKAGQAREVLELELAARAEQQQLVASLEHDVVAQLRAAADDRFTPEPKPDGALNISSWVGSGSAAWHTVFSYSSPEPWTDADGVRMVEPWFCSLDADAQRILLLLVAIDLEARQRAVRNTNGPSHSSGISRRRGNSTRIRHAHNSATPA